LADLLHIQSHKTRYLQNSHLSQDQNLEKVTDIKYQFNHIHILVNKRNVTL